MTKIALLGFGTVGRGLYNILKEKKELLNSLDINIEISKILVRNISKYKDIDKNLLTNDYNDIYLDKDIDIVVEMTGDVENSYIYIKKALENGKDVVSSNKAVVSKYFEELMEISQDKGRLFLYEASVGGTIPIVREVKSLSIFNNINKIYGVLNGTSNYILYNMFENNKDYAEVLKEAQEKGFAEHDPTDDVKGFDMRRKLRILMSIICKGKITEDDIEVFGLDKINKIDVLYLSGNYRVKEVCLGQKLGDNYVCIIEPCLFKKDEDLARLEGAYNMVEIYGDYFEKITLKGPGAGSLPTASAVLQDIIDVIKKNDIRVYGGNDLVNYNDNFEGQYYLRTSGDFPEDLVEREEIYKGQKIIFTKNIKRSDFLNLIKDKDAFFARCIN